MIDKERWDARYREGKPPWDTNKPDAHLVRVVDARDIQPCRVLEIGCGTGTNAVWLASMGFEVVATDISPTALALARQRIAEHGAAIKLLEASFPDGEAPFDFAFDRGVFHTSDGAEARAEFARSVADRLANNGLWLSIAGSTDGPPRDVGPPRLSAAALTAAVEPVFEILSLQSVIFETTLDEVPLAWLTLMRKRRTW